MSNYERDNQDAALTRAEDSAKKVQQDGEAARDEFVVTTCEGIRVHMSHDWVERMRAANYIVDVAVENDLPIYEPECISQREGVMVGNETARALIDIDRAMYDSYVPVIVDVKYAIPDEILLQMKYQTEFDGKELYLYATDEPNEKNVLTKLPEHFSAFSLHGVVVIHPRTR